MSMNASSLFVTVRYVVDDRVKTSRPLREWTADERLPEAALVLGGLVARRIKLEGGV